MLGYFSSFYNSKSYNKETVSPLLISISAQSEFSKVKDLFEKCVENLSLDGSCDDILNPIFLDFDNNQKKNFSNNLISYMKFQMNDKIKFLNQSAQLMLHFVSSSYQKFQSISEYYLSSINQIIEANENEKEMISLVFPFNIFIYCIDTLNNDDFLYQKDIFQKEMDKFDFTYKLTSIVFFIIHNRDYPIDINIISATDNIDIFKLIVFNGKDDLFISKKKQQNYFEKLYKNFIHNFDILLNNRIDPKISKETFEIFLFMNEYIFLYLCCDSNKIILNNFIKTNKEPIEYNEKSLILLKKLFKIEKNEDLLKIIKDYLEDNNTILKNNLLQNANNFRKLIYDFCDNIEKLTTYFQIMIKSIMLYFFTIYPDICEMISLSTDIINLIMDKMSYDNAYDLMILFLFSKSKNFYLTLKHLEVNVEALCLNCLTNILKQRLNYKKKFTYSIFFSLLSGRSLAENIDEISDENFIVFYNFINYFNTSDISMDNIYDNFVCLKIFYEIIFNVIRNIDSPSRFIYYLLINFGTFKSCHQKYFEFLSNNNKNENKGLIFEEYKKIYEKYENFVNDIKLKISNEGLDIKYSHNYDIISIINKCSFKNDENITINNTFTIFDGDSEKFIISTLHSFDSYSIFL